MLAACPELKICANMAVGYNNFDLPAMTARGVLGTNTPDVLTETTADFGFALLMATARRITESEHFLRAGKWTKWSYDMFAGSDMHGSTLGILGMGRIGQGIARRGAHGFGMNVIYHNRSRLDARAGGRVQGPLRRARKNCCATADHLVLVLPYSPASHHTIGAAELALMKPTATLVNIARGGIVDDAALAAALRDKRIAAAGLDVFEGEPKVHPDLLTVPNVVLTPHIASATVPDAPGHGQPGGRQPDRLPGARQAADAAEPRGAGRRDGHLALAELWILLALAASATLVLVICAAAAQAAGRRHRRAPNCWRANERLERELRREISESSRGARQETDAHAWPPSRRRWCKQGAEATRTQNAQIDAFAQQLALLQKTLADTLTTQLQSLSESNARRMAEVRATLETQLAQLQQTNAAKLDEMRKTVDEKLQTTLETRLGESFKQVADRLEQVHKGLGEMQTLAQGVGDLQRVLTNVKTRGMFGEVQLEALLEQVLTPEQYAQAGGDQAAQQPARGLRDPLPGPQRRRRAGVAADRRQVPARGLRAPARRARPRRRRPRPTSPAAALEARIRSEAKSICENYLCPPHTTDFAILFLPIESLYAEVLRRPGLMDSLQRDYRVTLAGPDHAAGHAQQPAHGLPHAGAGAAGLRGLEGAGRGEDRVRALRRLGGDASSEQVRKASDTLDKADTRTNQMRRALKVVEALPDGAGAGPAAAGRRDGDDADA